jgi:hypothetical protein
MGKVYTTNDDSKEKCKSAGYRKKTTTASHLSHDGTGKGRP